MEDVRMGFDMDEEEIGLIKRKLKGEWECVYFIFFIYECCKRNTNINNQERFIENSNLFE
jgi:hypothetical protein